MAEELLYPARCPLCDGLIPWRGERICAECRGNLPLIREPYCLSCGKPLEKEEEYCDDCTRYSHLFVQNRAVLCYTEPVRLSLYRLKYAGRREYGEVYAALAWQYLGEWIRRKNIDVIVPVPLHKSRLKKRGYNQALLFAKGLSECGQIPCLPHLAVRVRATRPQKELDRSLRQKNLKKAFKIRENDVKSKVILLVDDIYTTGSTLDALAGAFLQAGAGRVFCVTISVAAGRNGDVQKGDETEGRDHHAG
ncbi:MAG: ComF family protein [Lachnospiraceae bacterium]|nr:ComF family protein [Lachnospiraceae bacterium]